MEDSHVTRQTCIGPSQQLGKRSYKPKAKWEAMLMQESENLMCLKHETNDSCDQKWRLVLDLGKDVREWIARRAIEADEGGT
jgi:hypothetical protein